MYKRMEVSLITVLFLALLTPINITSASATPNITATGTNPSICNQTVSNTSGVSAARLSDGDCVIKFKTASTSIDWNVPINAQTIRLLVLGGGGGGGPDAGPGGSGGGAYEATGVIILPGSMISTYVAAGGRAGIYNGTSASSGESSTLTIGATVFTGTGGSVGPYGTSTTPQPAAGDAGNGTGTGGTATSGALGGTGKGWVSGSTGKGNAGNNGNLQTDITGTLTRYGSGGAGGANVSGISVTIVNGGAEGGGAAGYNSPSNTLPANGTANSGAGGGAGMSNVNPASFKSSGAGGSGLIVIRYAPDLIAPTFPSADTFNTPENSTAVGIITTSESATITIFGGDDQAKFSISRLTDSSTALSFSSAPNFEAPTDVGTNNTYVVVFLAVDGASNAGYETVTVTVTDVVDTSAFNGLSLAGAVTSASYRTAILITADISVASKVTFRLNGKVIPGCKKKLATGSGSSFTIGCNWRPSMRGYVTLVATANPVADGIPSATASPIKVFVNNRSGPRNG
jgi:hypothetical protein